MSLSSYSNVLPGSAPGCDDHFRFRPDGGRVAQFVLQSSEDEEEDDGLECEDIVVQLPAWSPPPPRQRQQRSRSFPRRWNPSGGLRRAAGRLSATGRLIGRRSVPSSSTSWDGRRALEQALLFAAAVPLRASSDVRAATATTTVVKESEQRGLDSTADSITATGPADIDNEQQSQSELAQNLFENDSVLSP